MVVVLLLLILTHVLLPQLSLSLAEADNLLLLRIISLPLPDFSCLDALKSLYRSHNQFDGRIPDSVFAPWTTARSSSFGEITSSLSLHSIPSPMPCSAGRLRHAPLIIYLFIYFLFLPIPVSRTARTLLPTARTYRRLPPLPTPPSHSPPSPAPATLPLPPSALALAFVALTRARRRCNEPLRPRARHHRPPPRRSPSRSPPTVPGRPRARRRPPLLQRVLPQPADRARSPSCSPQPSPAPAGAAAAPPKKTPLRARARDSIFFRVFSIRHMNGRDFVRAETASLSLHI